MRELIALALCWAWVLPAAVSAAEAPPPVLWYKQDATDWHEAMPIGNGRLGAMVFGGVERERIQFNEDTIWIRPAA